MRRMLAAVLGTFLTASCGVMKIDEVYYFAVPSGEDTNYYRLTVDAETVLSVSEYRSGWYPRDAVDNLFGQVNEDATIESRQALREAKIALNTALLETLKNYIAEAKKANPDKAELAGLLRARRQILAAPDAEELLVGDYTIAYNPQLELVHMHANDKLVFMLSANPDDVVGAIDTFSQSQETSLAIDELSSVVAQRAMREVIELEAENSAAGKFDKLLATQIAVVQSGLSSSVSARRLNSDLDILTNLIDNYLRSER